MQTSLLLALCLTAVVAVPKSPQRIVGGTTTTINNYPFAAALLYGSGNYYSQSCGGAILNNRSILSAAHCVVYDSPSSWRARIGSTYSSSGGTVYNVGKLITHSSYNSYTMDYDVAILQLSSSIVYGNGVQPVSIAGSNYNVNSGAEVTAIGWGTTSSGGSLSEQLREVQIWIVDQATCKSRYGAIGYSVTDNMLCSGWLDVGGRDQCQGDSGGPLVHNNVQIGICSWGMGCAQAQYPGVNTRVSRFSSWIQNNA